MRGQGRIYRPTYTDRRTGAVKHAAVWWLDYGVHGKQHRESSGTTNKQDAQRLLRQRLGDREAGRVVGRPDRVTFAQLRELAERQYQLDGRRSLGRLQDAFNRLEAFFGASTTVPAITTSRMDAYAESRLQQGAARSTVNYELAGLRRSFKLAIEKGLLATMPVIKLPKVRNARSGFFEEGEFAALLLELPPVLQPLIRFLRRTGWRRSEALGLTWNAIDWEGKVIRLGATDTKGGEARVFPFARASDLKALLEAQWGTRDGLFVFHDHGQRIGVGKLRSGWKRAVTRAGLAGRLVHDLRRSFARDMRRNGRTEGVIMRLAGWRSRSMFDRYNVIDEQDLADATADSKVTAKSEPAAQPTEQLS